MITVVNDFTGKLEQISVHPKASSRHVAHKAPTRTPLGIFWAIVLREASSLRWIIIFTLTLASLAYDCRSGSNERLGDQRCYLCDNHGFVYSMFESKTYGLLTNAFIESLSFYPSSFHLYLSLCQGLGPIFFQYGPRAWLIRRISCLDQLDQ